MTSRLDHLSPEQIQLLIARIPDLPAAEKLALLEDLEQYDGIELKKARAAARDDFLVFCHRMDPGFKEGPHHRHLRPLLQDMAAVWSNTEVIPPHAQRLTVSLAPRFGKSHLVAYLYVAWYLGHNPSHQIMMVTHTAELSEGFGKKVRDLIDSAEYQETFDRSVQVSKDKSAAGNWTTVQGGVYLALGVGGNAAGKGADLLVADDLVSEQAVLYGNPQVAFETAWTYMQVGPMQRLMPQGRMVFIGTRWGRQDPIAKAIQWSMDKKAEGALPWHEVRFPAMMEVERDGRLQTVSLWPEQWPIEELLAKKAGMRPAFWSAQYMQEPTSDNVALLKRDYWKVWPKEEPPEIDTVIQIWDTAHETKNRSDYSACVTFGVWFNEASNRNELMLLNAVKDRWEFPDLKRKAKEQALEWKPDHLLVEKKAAGAPLIQELRAMNLFVEEYSPSRGKVGHSNDKYARVNAIAVIFEDGCVWMPDTKWAREVREECAEYPSGEHDDYVDCLVAGTQVLMADGSLRDIESVLPGEFVHTPQGACRVLEAACTGVFPTWQLECGGRTIEATPNHPVATARGWVQMQDLLFSDTIKMVSTKEQTCREKKSSYFKGKSTTVTPILRALRTGATTVAEGVKACCTAPFGRLQTDPSLLGTRCITGMETSTTTLWKIWSFFLKNSIAQSTLKSCADSAQTRSESTSTAYVKRPLTGTQAMKVGSGTHKLLRKRFKKGALRMLRWLWQGRNAGKIRIVLRALSAALCSTPSRQQRSFVVTRACIESVGPTNSRRQVFNLSIEGAQCFYANGVLTHNCVTMGCMRFRQGGYLRLSDDEDDGDNEPTRPPVASYY
jgi:predicted phage terminase large subunit-like protein